MKRLAMIYLLGFVCLLSHAPTVVAQFFEAGVQGFFLLSKSHGRRNGPGGLADLFLLCPSQGRFLEERAWTTMEAAG